MANSEEAARQQARADYSVNPLTEKLTEQQSDWMTRNAYDAELERLRRLDDERKR